MKKLAILFVAAFFSCQSQNKEKQLVTESKYGMILPYDAAYLETLKKGRQYDFSDERYIPQFTYQEMTDEKLVNLRQVFNLDSIAGSGNDVSKMINLMRWVHGIVRHEGFSSNPESMNALDLITICKAENRGLNCRMMATILNECYLAIGLKSRFVTCMPKETDVQECHVINMVYSSEADKWVWMDPTYSAYVMDEKGELLGPSEVREKLIKGQTLQINPEANYNNESSVTKESYLDTYMAKNLYRMECLSASVYDAETFNGKKNLPYVELLPLDGIVQLPQKEEVKYGQYGEYVIVFYKTNNPELFWAKPE